MESNPTKSFCARRIRMFLDYSVTKTLNDQANNERPSKIVSKNKKADIADVL